MTDNGKRLPMGGVYIDFPFAKPYPAQMQMMSKIIAALKGKENALLESPTGSGKSLALLCSVLAWVGNEREKMAKDPKMLHYERSLASKKEELGLTIKGKIKLDAKDEKTKHELENDIKQLEQLIRQAYGSIPKVYYGTRTHRQIKQIIKELKRTNYGHVKMTVLGSRDQYCVYDEVKQAKVSRTEACVSVVNGKTITQNGTISQKKVGGCNCPFRAQMMNLKDPDQQQKGKEYPDVIKYDKFLDAVKLDPGEPWDIEDLVKHGRRHTYCPYFMAKAIKTKVEIIFAPYNYLLDAGIRAQLGISLKGQIIMLDEAHNVEDISRRSASLEAQLEARNLEESMADFNSFLSMNQAKKDEVLQYVGEWKNFIEDLINFLRDDKVHVNMEKRDQYTVMELDRLSEAMKRDLGLEKERVEKLKNSHKGLAKQEITNRVRLLMDGVVRAYDYMMNKKNTSAYRVLVKKEPYNAQTHQHLVRLNKKNDFLKDIVPDFYHELQFQCMSPAVSFGDFAECHSILLASGTLSPLETFEAELGVTFKHKVEANHVIRPEQVFCRYLNSGPENKKIRAVYSNRDNESMLIEVGRLLLNAVEDLAQGGVLVFFTSYGTLKNHVFHWKKRNHRIWQQLEDEADVFLENSAKGSADFNQMLEQFNAKCLKSKAILLAVCRGKISEGIDFADDAARIVMTVGIPYPAAMDPVTKAKKEYNDQLARSSPKSIDGRRWYEIQAFRAINQALGRCLRHSGDWGAILLVDERWDEGTNLANVSKWLRRMARPQGGFDRYSKELRSFLEVNEDNYKDERVEKISKMVKVKEEQEEKENIKPSYPMFNKPQKFKVEPDEVEEESDEEIPITQSPYFGSDVTKPFKSPVMQQTVAGFMATKSQEYESGNIVRLSEDEEDDDDDKMDTSELEEKLSPVAKRTKMTTSDSLRAWLSAHIPPVGDVIVKAEPLESNNEHSKQRLIVIASSCDNRFVWLQKTPNDVYYFIPQ